MRPQPSADLPIPNSGRSSGKLFLTGDPGDFYQVSLNGDEIISLTIADTSADLDLRLWDEQQNLIDASLGINSTESVEVPNPGNYYIEVFPFSGASNYVMVIGRDAVIASEPRKPTRMSDPFISRELIVKPARVESDFTIASKHGLVATRAFSGQSAPQKSGVTPLPGLFALKQSWRDAIVLPAGGVATSPQKDRLATLLAVKRLQTDSAIEFAEPNLLIKPHANPDDSFYSSQWHYPAINLPLAWDILVDLAVINSPDVIVAVVDTGVLLNHPDLTDKLVPGYDFISDAGRARDGDGIDGDPNDDGDLEFGGSSSFHGTHVAGTVGAESNNGSGVAGVSWGTRIMPMRALGKDGGSTFDVIQAVRYAAGLENSSGQLPTQRADIINLSLGSSFSSQSEQDAYTAAVQAGALIVASAGNDASAVPTYPAAYDGVVSVSATTITGDRAGYSNFGEHIDIAAPGGSNLTDLNGDGIGDGVLSTMGDDGGGNGVKFGYASLTGTSMAAPHVAGVMALMKAVHPALTPVEFTTALIAGELTDDIGLAGRDDNFGWGMINAQKAVIAAENLANGQGTDPGPILVSSASTLNFGAFTTQLNLTLSNAGTGAITITNVSSNRPWVTATPPASADGLGEYQISVNRSGLSDGAYQATLTFNSNANTVATNIIMQISSLNLTANAGLHYIILVDENGDTVLPAVLVNPVDGTYPFAINNVPFGRYRLFAGSDSDDDALLCDAGEACGAYPTLDAPDFLSINADMTGLEFESSYRLNITNSTISQSANQGEDTEETGITFTKPQDD